MSVLFDQRRTATVQAVTFCDLFTLTQRDLYTLLDSFPGFAEKMRELALARCATFYPDLMSTLELGEEDEEIVARQQHASSNSNLSNEKARQDVNGKTIRDNEIMASPAKQNSVGRVRTMMATSGASNTHAVQPL